MPSTHLHDRLFKALPVHSTKRFPRLKTRLPIAVLPPHRHVMGPEPGTLAIREKRLPQMRLMAECDSAPLAADAYFSSLVVVWFQDDLDITLDARSQRFATLDWEAHALDGRY